MRRAWALGAAVWLLAAGAGAQHGESPSTGAASPAKQAAADGLRKQSDEAIGRGDYATAKDALLRLRDLGVREYDEAPALEYNLACVRARLGEAEGALDGLEKAIALGFTDFDHMERDPDLASVRESARFRLILAARGDLLDARGEADLESWKEALGSGYAFTRLPDLRLNIASCFDERTTSEAVGEMTLVEAWARELLSPERAGGAKPQAWCTVVLPTRAHFARLVPAPGVGGVYDRDRRALIAQELGASLRHEFLHVLHHRRMAELGQSHAWWVQEGLAALVEDVKRKAERAGEGSRLEILASWRTNIAKRLERRGALTGWKTLCAMPRERFVGARPIANYSQARALMMYLHATGTLGAWMREYESRFAEDATGLTALETVLGPLAKAEAEYRAWLRALPEVAEEIRPGMASLGVIVGPGKGDGPVVEEFDGKRERGGDPLRRLRLGDVITGVGSDDVRTMEDLVRALAEREVGERVIVRVRRGSNRLEVEATLRAQGEESP